MAGPSGAKVSRALGAPPLQILLRAVLPVAVADVVAAGDAEDGVARLLAPRRPSQVLADHHHQLAFVVHVGGVARESRWGRPGSCSAVIGL